ncbi:MAG: hypothetical protein ACRDL6_03580 [Solirubrobacterales bacterium]
MSTRAVRAASWAGLRRYAEPGLIAAALGVVYLALQPPSADHAAQVFRSGLFEQAGVSAWNNLWFGGHHLPGYSLLFPPLGALIGPREVGALAIVVAALLFAAIAYRHWGDRARLGILWFATGTSISLFTGRLTFALGIAVALAAIFAAQRGWRLTGIGLAGLSALASPVAALFLGCGAVAYAFAERSRRGLELAATSVGMVILLALTFPEGGTEPFVFSSFQPALLVAIAVFIALPREEKLLRYGVAAYGAALAAAFLIQTPMGGNATRMGALLLGPVLAFGLWRRQRFALILLVPVLVYWQWSPVVRDLEEVHAQPSVEPSYYAPVQDFLRGQPDRRGYRVEVLPVAHHWEAAYMPKGIYIARGWERQLDRKLNPLFYQDTLGAQEYRQWLDRLGVGFVAVPEAPLDYAAEAEAQLIARGVPYLEPAFRNPDWTVYRVRDAAPLVIGAGELVKLTPEGFVVYADAPGTALVKVHWTPYWSIEQGTGCVEGSPGGFTTLHVTEPGRFRAVVDFAPWRVLSDGPRCADRPPATGGWEQARARDGDAEGAP